MDNNVIPLKPMKHLTVDVFEQRHGFLAEAHMNGQLLWEYESDSLENIRSIILRTLGNLND